MFYLLVIGGAFLVCLAVFGLFALKRGEDGYRILCVMGAILGLVLFVCGWFTPQGSLTIKRLMASGSHGNWIVVDNSGGETLRHWVLIDSFCESSDQSDGWQFYDSTGLNYVSGDAFVKRIDNDINFDDFLKNYKEKYNIPEEQEPLK